MALDRIHHVCLVGRWMGFRRPMSHTTAQATKPTAPFALEDMDTSDQGELCSRRKAPETTLHDVESGPLRMWNPVIILTDNLRRYQKPVVVGHDEKELFSLTQADVGTLRGSRTGAACLDG